MLSLSCPRTAFGGSNGLVIYQGRIARPDGGTLNSGNVTFALSIYSPAPTQCLLYSETQVVNMSGSLGMFSLQLGAGTRTDGGSHSFNDVFINGKTLSSLTCVSGSTYTGGPADDRDLRVSFNDSGTIVNLSSMAIKSVPFALQAHEIDGWGLNNLVKVSSIGNATTFTTAEMANAKLLTAPGPCATNEILKWNGSAWGCSADATGGTPADAAYTGTKGIVAFDTDALTSGITVASGIAKLSNTGVTAATYGTAAKVPAIAINAQGRITTASEIPISIPFTQITGGSASAGDVLKWNGSAWLPAADATGTSPGDASFAAKGLVQGDTDAATSGLNLSSGVISVNSGTGANQIVKLDAASKLPAVDGSALTNLSANNVTSGTLPVSRGGTGSSSFAGDNLVGTNATGTALQAVTCAQNQVLSFDASGKYGCYNLSAIAGGTYFANGGNSFGGATSLGTNDSYALNFKTNNTAWMTIDTAGNVGIGTSAPSSNLHVFQNSNVAASSKPAALFSVQMMSGEPEWGIPRLNYALMLQDRGTGATAGPAIGFKTTDGIGASISMSEVQTAQGGSLELNTSADSTTTSTRMVILNTGNVGIGTTSPAAKLHVSGGHIAVDNNKTVAFFDNSATNTIGSYLSLTTGNNFQIINLTSAGNTQYQNLNNTGAHIFYTGVGGTERMRITSAGNIGIGTATPAAKLEVNGDITVDSLSSRAGSGMDLHLTSDNSGAVDLYDGVNNHALSIFDGATVKTQIWATGSSYFNGGNVGIGTTTPSYKLHVVGTAGLSTGTAWTNASDIRLKDIDGDYEYGLDEILKLHTVRFHYKKDNALNIPSDHPMTGFIAQEVQKVIPDAVHVRDDGYLELNVDPIHWATVNAVQQLHGMCKMTKTQMQLIKAKVESHDRRIASVETVNRRLENENEILRKKNEKLESQVSSLTMGMRTLNDENKKMKDDIQYILQKLSERK